MAATGRAHGVGSGENAHPWADALRELVGEEIVWPWPDRAPTPHGRRLMEALGVVGMPENTVKVSAHELLTTRDCAHPGCVDQAEPRIDYCRAHAPVAELRANGSERPPAFNGRLAWTRASIIAAMQRWAAERGSPPSSSGTGPMSWAKSGEWWPSVATVIYHFGTWREAVLAAGLTPLGDTLAEARKSGREPSAGEAAVSVPTASRDESESANSRVAVVEPVTPAELELEPASRSADDLEAAAPVIDGEIVPTNSFAAVAAELEAAFTDVKRAEKRLHAAAAAFRRVGLPIIVEIEGDWGISLTEDAE